MRREANDHLFKIIIGALGFALTVCGWSLVELYSGISSSVDTLKSFQLSTAERLSAIETTLKQLPPKP